MAACGALLPFVIPCFRASERQRRVRAGCASAWLRRPSLREDCPAVLGLVARRETHYAHFVRCVQTIATSQMTKRAARAATSPGLAGRAGQSPAVRKAQTVHWTVCVPAHLLGASDTRCRNLPGHAFALAASLLSEKLPHRTHARLPPLRRFSSGPPPRSRRGRRYPSGAMSVATRSAGSRSARASALRHLTRRSCLSAANEVSVASSATRPRDEHRSAVGAGTRSGPAPTATVFAPDGYRLPRRAPTLTSTATRTTAMRRKQTNRPTRVSSQKL